MTIPRDHLLPEKANDDGNCAFNAFILGLTDEGVLHALKLDDLTHFTFIDAAKTALNLKSQATTKDLINEMRRLKKEKPIELQKKLAPVLRSLAITLAENDSDNCDRTLIPLEAAFNNYMSDTSGDDIFKRINVVKNKFEEYKQQKTAWKAFAAWWKQDGYKKFLQEMAKDQAWAGDLELYQLGKYFGVNICEYRSHHYLYSNFGTLSIKNSELPQLTDEGVIEQLVSRGVIGQAPENSPDSNKLVYKLQMDAAQYKHRVSAIPDYERVSNFITENSPTLQDTPVPATWSEECKAELKQRNIIDQNEKFQLDAHTAILRIGEIPNLSFVEVNANQSPIITLTNPEGVHWDNMHLSPKKIKKVTLFDEGSSLDAPVSTIVPSESSPDVFSDMPPLVSDHEEELKSQPLKPELKLKPAEPQPVPLQPTLPTTFENYRKALNESEIAKEWQVAETVSKENNASYYKVSHQKDTTKNFLVYEDKLTTRNSELETFVAMIKAYKAIYGDTPPTITTHEKAEANWEAAYREVYKTDRIPDGVITLPVQPEAPRPSRH